MPDDVPEHDSTHPVSVSAIDAQYTASARIGKIRRVALLVVVAVVGLAVLGLAFLVNNQRVQINAQRDQIATQQRQIDSSCQVWLTVGSLPPVTAAGSKAPTKEGVTLITSSRNAFIGEGCGKLPPPSAVLVHWAEYYQLKLDQ